MKVGHVVVAGEVGGAERMLVTLAKSQETHAEHAVFLATPGAALREMLSRAGLALHDRGAVRESPLAFLWQQLGPRDVAWLTRALREARVDVVHVHTLGSQMLGARAARRLGLPLIRTEHSTRAFDDPTAWPFARYSLGRAALSVAVSEFVAARVRDKAPWARDKVRVIPNGVDTERFALAAPLPSGRPLTLLFLGRLEPRKGADLALRALARTTSPRLIVCGDGQDRDAISSLIRELGLSSRVELRGHVDDAARIIPEAHAIVASSREEGLGIAFLEAMAMGRPVVGLDTGGIAEITSRDTSLVATPRARSDEARVETLAARLRDAERRLFDLADLGVRARQLVVERYSRASMATAYGDAYRAISRARS